MQKQARLQRLEHFPTAPTSSPVKSKKVSKNPPAADEGTVHKGIDHAGSPSSEASEEEAPVGHAPVTSEQKIQERSKYEAAEPYRSKKGDRFS